MKSRFCCDKKLKQQNRNCVMIRRMSKKSTTKCDKKKLNNRILIPL